MLRGTAQRRPVGSARLRPFPATRPILDRQIRRRPRRGPRPAGRTTNGCAGPLVGCAPGAAVRHRTPRTGQPPDLRLRNRHLPDRGWHPHYERNLRAAARRSPGPVGSTRRPRPHTRRGPRMGCTAMVGRLRRPPHRTADTPNAWPRHGSASTTTAARPSTPRPGKNSATRDFATRCRALDIPVLIVDGDADIRPRWAVDSLHQALPNAERVSLAGAGHLPWVENRDDFQPNCHHVPDRRQPRHPRAGSSRTPGSAIA